MAVRPTDVRLNGTRGVAIAGFVAALLGTAGCVAVTGREAGPHSGDREGPDQQTWPSFSVYTHCGVENVRIDGRWWHAKAPLYDDGRTGPPDGWGDPYQEGRLTVESAKRAVFEFAGQRVVFVPAPNNAPVRVCR